MSYLGIGGAGGLAWLGWVGDGGGMVYRLVYMCGW